MLELQTAKNWVIWPADFLQNFIKNFHQSQNRIRLLTSPPTGPKSDKIFQIFKTETRVFSGSSFFSILNNL